MSNVPAGSDVAGKAYVGTSGWNYAAWKDDFYAGIPRSNWLRFCAERFTGIEVNATFYRLQTSDTFRRWHDETPDDFRFAIKGNRYLTHNKKLIDPGRSIPRDRERAQGLGHKLAAVLWQLPARFKKDIERLADFASALQTWPETRHAIEFRHRSWFDAEVAACLREARLATCISDAADWPMWGTVTTDLVYVRLHGHTRTYASAYTAASLSRWAELACTWLAQNNDVHIYFDNDAEGAAPHDAIRLLQMIRARARLR